MSESASSSGPTLATTGHDSKTRITPDVRSGTKELPSYLDQPGYGQPGSMPPTYRAWGIVAVICGALLNLILGVPTAIVGLRSGGEVPRLWASGDVQAAVRASRKARAWLAGRDEVVKDDHAADREPAVARVDRRVDGRVLA